MSHHHFVQHFLRRGDYVRTEFTCTAPEGSACRMACKRCMDEQRESCECSFTFDEPRDPHMVDLGYCNAITWLVEGDASEEMFNGTERPVRGPDPQPIELMWTGEDYGWDYTS